MNTKTGQKVGGLGQDVGDVLWKALDGYMTRMTETAQASSDFADAGRKRFTEGGDPTGLAQQVLGGLGWALSPASALVPHGSEEGLPEDAQPFARAGMDLADIFMPGPGEFMPAALIPMLKADPKRMKLLPEYSQRQGEMSQIKDPGELSHAIQSTWEDTGIDTPGVDLVPRFEIPDTGGSFSAEFEKFLKLAREGESIEAPLEYILQNPELYQYVPELKNANFKGQKVDANTWGSPQGFTTDIPGLGMDLKLPMNYDELDLLNFFAHEGQHLIDFASDVFLPIQSPTSNRGGFGWIQKQLELNDNDLFMNPVKSWEAANAIYSKLHTEALARNAEIRRVAATGRVPKSWAGGAFGSAQTYPIPEFGDQLYAPSLTSPVPFEDQIYSFNVQDPRLIQRAKPAR